MFFFLFLFGVAGVLFCSNLVFCWSPLADRALLYRLINPDQLTRWLINPVKNKIAKISKLFIENINTKVRFLFAVQYWKDTDSLRIFRAKGNTYLDTLISKDFTHPYVRNFYQKTVYCASTFVRISKVMSSCIKKILAIW